MKQVKKTKNSQDNDLDLLLQKKMNNNVDTKDLIYGDLVIYYDGEVKILEMRENSDNGIFKKLVDIRTGEEIWILPGEFEESLEFPCDTVKRRRHE